MVKRSLGLSAIGYGLLVISGLWLVTYLVAVILSFIVPAEVLRSPIAVGEFKSAREFQHYAGLLWVFHALQAAGLVGCLKLREWGRRLVIGANAVICIAILARMVFVTGTVDGRLMPLVFLYVLVIVFLTSPRIQRQFGNWSLAADKTILVVDDDKSFVKMIKTKLAAKGFSVVVALTGEQGLQQAKNYLPDLIVLDVILPGIKGRAVCVQLKQDAETKNIPVIFLTAKDSPDDVRAELEAGAITHLTKPVDAEVLVAEIKKILGI